MNALETARRHHDAGRLSQAEAIYRQILTADPNNPAALHLLGWLAFQVNRPDVAADLINRAIAVHPSEPHFHHSLGQVLLAQSRFDPAAAAFQKVISLQPRFADAYCNLGVALMNLARWDEAIDAYHKALSLNPNMLEAHHNLANVLRWTGQVEAATAEYRKALALSPDHPLVHVNLASILLLQGNFTEGWPHHEWRLRAAALGQIVQQFSSPIWDGGDLRGRRILLHTEQGFGDAIQFVRYVPLVAQRGATVILQCQPELMRLFQSIEGVEKLIARGEPLPQFDLHSPLLSLPRHFETIPADVPYLRADRQKWEKRLNDIPGLKIGLAWTGRAYPDAGRSVPPAALAPLAQVPGARFIAIQKDDLTNVAHKPPPQLNLTDWTSEFTDFADTAALIENLDLIITIDTAAAHLAGALGRPVWLLCKFDPDWRWMLKRDDSSWYPTLRLFRQPKPGDWETPIQTIAQELRSWRK